VRNFDPFLLLDYFSCESPSQFSHGIVMCLILKLLLYFWSKEFGWVFDILVAMNDGSSHHILEICSESTSLIFKLND
jgi:hypothetical protein